MRIMTVELSNTDFAAHMRERRDTRPTLFRVWVGESRLYARGMLGPGDKENYVRMGKPLLSSMVEAIHATPNITVQWVKGTRNHNGNAWNLRVEYTAKDYHEFERLVL